MPQTFHSCVQCIVLSDVKVLMGKRFRTDHEGEWGLPGGHVENNETFLQAAERELFEETTLKGVAEFVGPSFITQPPGLPYIHVPVMFGEVRGTPAIPVGEKFSELEFFSLDNLPREIFKPAQIALKLYRITGIRAVQHFVSLWNLFE